MLLAAAGRDLIRPMRLGIAAALACIVAGIVFLEFDLVFTAVFFVCIGVAAFIGLAVIAFCIAVVHAFEWLERLGKPPL